MKTSLLDATFYFRVDGTLLLAPWLHMYDMDSSVLDGSLPLDGQALCIPFSIPTHQISPTTCSWLIINCLVVIYGFGSKLGTQKSRWSNLKMNTHPVARIWIFDPQLDWFNIVTPSILPQSGGETNTCKWDEQTHITKPSTKAVHLYIYIINHIYIYNYI